MLCAIPSSTDIFGALKSMPSSKSPGPDGMTVLFFLSCWGIVGLDVVASVQSFFISGIMQPELNQTNLVILPKSTVPCYPSQFRPISLCNIIYKLITKIMADRLKILLPQLISPF